MRSCHNALMDSDNFITSVTLGVTDLFWKYRKCHLAFHAWPVVKHWLVKHCCGNIRTRSTTNTLLIADSHNEGQWILQSNLKWTCANLWSLEYPHAWPVVTHHCSDMHPNKFELFGSYHNMKIICSKMFLLWHSDDSFTRLITCLTTGHLLLKWHAPKSIHCGG